MVSAVIANYNGEQVCRIYRKGASAFMLSPDSFDPNLKDIVFDDPDTQAVELQGVIKWYQASRVKRY